MPPRISIGLPLYNGERYLEETLESVLSQDFTDFELLISDNGSTDSSQAICDAYARKDGRIRYTRLPKNLGAAANYNRVFRMAQGEYFKWIAHDDRIKPSFLSRCIEKFESFEGPPVLIYPKTELIDQNGHVVGENPPTMRATSNRPFLRAFEAIQGMGAVADAVFGVFKRNMLTKTRLIGHFFAADRVVLFEAALLGHIVQLEGEPLFQRRIHPEMSTKANLSHEDRLRWYDPNARVTLSPESRIVLEYLRSTRHAALLSPRDRAICFPATLLGVTVRGARVPLGRYRRCLCSTVKTAVSRRSWVRF